MWGQILDNRSYQIEDDRYKFTSKERDFIGQFPLAKRGNDYFGARYYDARVGRWGSVDSLLEKHYDYSPYNYVLDNPLMYIDPDGRQVSPKEVYEKKLAKEIQAIENALYDFYKTGAKILDKYVIPYSLGFIIQHILESKKTLEVVKNFVTFAIRKDIARTIAKAGLQFANIATNILLLPDDAGVPKEVYDEFVKENARRKREFEKTMREAYGEEWDYMNIKMVFNRWVTTEVGPGRYEKLPQFDIIEDIIIHPTYPWP